MANPADADKLIRYRSFKGLRLHRIIVAFVGTEPSCLIWVYNELLRKKSMITGFLASILLLLLTIPTQPCHAQTLADVARRERARREDQKPSSKVFTNEDLNRYENQESSSGPQTTETELSEESKSSEKEGFPSTDAEERAWSKRFIEAKTKVQQAKAQDTALQTKLNDLNLKLMRADPQASGTEVFDREHLYLPLIAQTKEKIEKNKNDLAAAESELEALREELRRSGKPISWSESQAALRPESKGAKAAQLKTKDKKYWMEQLALVDKRYEELIAPLQEERFQLINRRPAAEGESKEPSANLGMGLPPGVIDIDVQIKELNRKREQEKATLVDKAVHEGALPGWFRQ